MSRVFALTGGIACGKSTVSRVFSEAGIPVVDADRIAREVVAPGTRGLQQIIAEFGDVLHPDGTIDRPKLGSAILLNPEKWERLHEIMFPLIAARSTELMQSHLAKHDLVCYDAPTLIEVGMHNRFRPLVVVIAPEYAQLQRLIKRDGFTAEEARARVSSQIPLKDKAKLADFVIENDQTFEELKTRSLNVLAKIRETYYGR
jgi:dephospho-CoA kinase